MQKLLRKLEKTRSTFWNLSPDSAFFLNQLVKTLKIKTALEIGTSNGYSGIWLAEALSHTDGHLYTIESHKDRFALAKKNFQKSKLKNITQIFGHAPEAIPKNPKFFDLIFFDATKYEYVSYYEVLKNRVRKNGVLVADNIFSHKKDLLKFLKTVNASNSWKAFELPLGTGLLVAFKTA